MADPALVDARTAAARQYAAAHDHWATQQQLAALKGSAIEAEACRQMAHWVLRAYEAEWRDPKPEGLD